MAENTLPKKNIAHTFYVALVDTGSRPDLKANPTLAAGDVQVSTDGAGYGNLGTLPVVTPASGEAVKVDLSAAEMNGDNVTVKFIDAAGSEWDSLFIEIRPATRKVEDLAFPTAPGRSFDVTSTGAIGVDWGNVENQSTAVDLSATDIQLCDTVTTLTNQPSVFSGTADTGTTTTLVDSELSEPDDGHWEGSWVHFTSGNLSGQTRLITVFEEFVNRITFAPATTQAVATQNYQILPAAATGVDWGSVQRATTAVDLSATDIQLCDTITTYTGDTPQTGDNFARIGAPAGASISADIADVPTVSEFNARTLVAASYFDPAADTVATVTTVTNQLTAITIGDQVWDTDATARQTAGTFGQAIGDPGVNTETMYDAVVTDAAGTNVAADVIAVKAETATILVDTGTTLNDHLTDIKGTGFVKDTHSLIDIETFVDVLDDGTSGNVKIATDVAATLVDTADMQPKLGTPVADVSADIAVIEAQTDDIGLAGAGLSAIPWNPAWDVEVESEVNDALDTAIAELGVGAPTATPTLRTGLMLLYHALAFKTVVQTAGVDALEIYNSAGTKIAAKLLTDDGADYQEARSISG